MSIRKALLVGISAYPIAPLRGCINDVRQMQDLLTRFYGFPDQDIRILLDGEATLANIEAGINWLAQDRGNADAVRVFHFSGHGKHIADKNGDEPDGRDECLVPQDFQTAGYLTDDSLKRYYDRFPSSGNLTLIMDCCHSGTIQKTVEEDRIYRFMPVSAQEQKQIDAAARKFAEEQYQFVLNQVKAVRDHGLSDEELFVKVHDLMNRFQKARFGDVRVREANVLLAGCRPDQQAADASIGGRYQGAFTNALAETIREFNGQITYRQLVEQATQRLDAARFAQIPQLEYGGQRDRQLAFQPFQ